MNSALSAGISVVFKADEVVTDLETNPPLGEYRRSIELFTAKNTEFRFGDLVSHRISFS